MANIPEQHKIVAEVEQAKTKLKDNK